jgi:plasmid stability protein
MAIKPAKQYAGSMKTTLDLPDELMRTIKIRAAQQGRKIKDVVAELLSWGLSHGEVETANPTPRRVRLPLVQCGAAAQGREMTPQHVATVLLDEEADWSSGRDDAAL